MDLIFGDILNHALSFSLERERQWEVKCVEEKKGVARNSLGRRRELRRRKRKEKSDKRRGGEKRMR